MDVICLRTQSMSMALPLQLKMLALFGCDRVPAWSDDPNECKAIMRSGRKMLVESTGVDLQYDVHAWRQYLLEHHHDAYAGGRTDFDNYVVNRLMSNSYAMRLLTELAEENGI
jgi:hypothetical protein